MRTIRSVTHLAVIASLGMFTSFATAQVKQPYNGNLSIVVTPVAPVAPVTASIDVFAQCTAPTGPSLLKSGTQNSVLGGADVPLALAAKLTSGASVCAIETFTGPGAPPVSVFPLAIVANAPPVSPVTIETPSVGQQYVLVDPVPPALPGQTGTLDVYAACPPAAGPAGTSLLQLGQQTAVGSSKAASVTLVLAKPLASGDSLCAVEKFSGAPAKPDVLSALVMVAPAAPAIATTPPTSDALEAADQAIRSEEALCTPKRNVACLKMIAPDYISFDAKADAGVKASVTAKAGQNWQNDYLQLKLLGVAPPAAGAAAPAVPADLQAGTFALTRPASVTHARILAGVDVSAASSTDPAAKFLLDATLNIPISKGSNTPGLTTNNWLWGYARISSIAQPGAIGGVSAPSTYVTALTAASPNAIVQSFEATGGYEYRLATFDNASGLRPILFSLIAGAGVITPLSDTQATPNVYIASPAIQSYYLTQATSSPSTVNTENATAIAAAGCPAPSSPGALPAATPVCYIAQYPEARSRFFRNYAAGLRFKRYYFNSIDDAYIFPANFDLTLGQNEYVTGGLFHRVVIHFGGSTPLPASISVLQGVYVYAYMDIVPISSSVPTNQYLLLQAPGTVTTSSSSVASILVGQPDRDRYRFGIAYDLTTLIKKLTPAKTP
jgi:hypothetical protein